MALTMIIMIRISDLQKELMNLKFYMLVVQNMLRDMIYLLKL
jgi:hypothetical protein